ncbi:thiol-disulfide oxidoreductase DCC family protein [Flavobacterium wongokense]|uniref:thiol-disulfide oxidoreductase DCC family protein n=1 Tax=Flavobacterium wongokense TaxID=2910674 RepID=UPI001F218BB4|nr:thiol-disulfide oxidoreductase DCC family protein [Flavobacterium sp. WG47]MCF6131973.1 thiol-disulfide oxidoreductase DCC family protein [Flavobacterium sp. WG47]
MEISNLPKDKKIILFDGVCNLCDSSVQFVIRHDKKDIFRFVALQSELGQKIINHIGISDSKIDSTILYEPAKAYYYKSDVAFKILKEISGIHKILLVFSVLPKSFLDFVYDYVAKRRYKWFGQKESCMVPTPELQSKFLA